MNGRSGVAQKAPVVGRLRRVLGLWDLIFYGIITVGLVAPVTVFGIALTLSRGHAVDTLLIAMIAMVLTAFSYGRMAALFPSAGSAYTYVGRGLNPHLGFLAGWAMLLDYLVMPTLCVIFGALSAQRLVSQIPYAVLAALIAGTITFLNLRGIRSVARANQVMLTFIALVFLVFIFLALQYLFQHEGWAGIFSWRPFYNPQTFNLRALAGGTSFAALNYLGFDSVTTLAEDVENPRRNILLATVLVCLFTGIFSSLIVYLGQRVWPNYETFAHIETSFMDVTQRVGGQPLFLAMVVVLVVAVTGSALAAQAGASRLLFGFGRDNVLPRRLFAHLDPKRNTPKFNIWIIGLFAFAGSLLLGYQLTGELLNFGAFFGFMGVNLATIQQFFILPKGGRKRRLLADGVAPAVGFLFCFAIWLGLEKPAKLVGGTWFLVGLIYDGIRTRGFRLRPVMLDVDDK
jgi:amino acid transporter